MRPCAVLQMPVFPAPGSVNVPRALLAMAAGLAVFMASALGIFARVEITHIYLFLFFFAHILTFLGLGCVSRAK